MHEEDQQKDKGLIRVKPSDLKWKIKIATEADVESAVAQLSSHMNAQQREAFRDKLQRYVWKPDRDLFIAMSGNKILGFGCLIEEAEVPASLPPSMVWLLRTFACGTGLMVHPDFRKRGIGSSLFRRLEQWSKKRGRSGFWGVTRRMAYWYRRDFGYEEVGRIRIKGVEKKVIAKTFL